MAKDDKELKVYKDIKEQDEPEPSKKPALKLCWKYEESCHREAKKSVYGKINRQRTGGTDKRLSWR